MTAPSPTKRRRRKSPVGCNAKPIALRFQQSEYDDFSVIVQSLGSTMATIARECVMQCYPELGKRG